MLTSKRNRIEIPPGINKDDNSYTAFQWSDADKIRFYQGYPQKIGGWKGLTFNNKQTLNGVCRSMWGYIDNTGVEHLLIGTSTRLYSYENSNLYNITPLVNGATTIANSLSTNYQDPLNNDPIETKNGTTTITLSVAPLNMSLFQVGDTIKISGATDVGGILAANINGTFNISSVDTLNSKITYQATTTATDTETGGGAIVILSTRVISVFHMAHGFSDGDRIKISGAIDFGGFIADDLNIEAIIRNVSDDAYSYYSTTASVSGNFANSSVINGGGPDTAVQGQIAAGNCAISQPLGYSGGLYGVGTYSTGKEFSGINFALPQIWSFSKLNNTVVLTPGNQGGLYLWNGDIATAPVLQTTGNVPTAINYVTIENDQIIVFGAGGIPNNMTSTNNITNWNPATNSSVQSIDFNTSGTLIASAYSKGQVLVFSENAIFIMRYVGLPNVWVTDILMTSDGILGPKALTTINDNIIWVGQNNFYIYNGSIVSTIPNNTIRQWFFSNLNSTSYYHSFVHKSIDFSEIWFFAPFGSSVECNNYIIWNWEEGHFTNGLLERTASEDPSNLRRNQYLINGKCDASIPTTLYAHEIYNDYTDDGSDMTGSLTSNDNLIGEGDYMQEILRVVPSTSVLPIGTKAAGNILFSMTIKTKEYDGNVDYRTFGPYNILDNTRKIETRANGRQRQYTFNFSNKVGFRFEKFFEELRTTTPR